MAEFSTMHAQRGRIVSGGRLQVPADMRRLLGLDDGAPVLMRVIEGELHVRPLRDALARVQARLKPYALDGAPLSDELISDRRRAADDE